MNTKAFSDGNNSNEYNALSEDKRNMLVNWIEVNLEPHRIKSFQNHHSSYGLKHLFEKSEQGFYITNGEYKGAMLAAGFEPKDTNDLNWIFRLGKRAATQIK